MPIKTSGTVGKRQSALCALAGSNKARAEDHWAKTPRLVFAGPHVGKCRFFPTAQLSLTRHEPEGNHMSAWLQQWRTVWAPIWGVGRWRPTLRRQRFYLIRNTSHHVGSAGQSLIGPKQSVGPTASRTRAIGTRLHGSLKLRQT